MAESNSTNLDQIRPRKRVFFVITQSEFGGAQRFLYNLISHLDLKRYEILIAAGKTGDHDFLGKALSDLGFTVIRVASLQRKISILSDLLAIKQLREIIIDRKPDVLFLISSKTGFIGALAARFPKRIKALKVIYRLGGWSFNDPGPNWKKYLFRLLEKISAQWKDVIIVNSQRDFAQTDQFNIKPRTGIFLVANGLDVYKINFLDRQTARLKLFEKALPYSGKVFQTETVIGTIANFYPSKGLQYLIEAADHFKNKDNVAFFIIGDGPERVNLELMIKNHGLDKKVFLLGQMADAYQYLPAFDIFVLPSVKEGFPWALIEAMAAKLPVIGTNVGAVPEIIEDGQNGFLVKPANSTEIVRRLKELLANEIRQQEIGIRAHQTVLLKYDLNKMVSKIEALL